MKLSLSVALLWLLEHSAFAWDGTSFCDNSRYLLEWSDEFDGASLDESKWSTVCSDGSDANSSCLAPFPAGSNGAECRSATCLSSLVSVDDGVLTLTSQRDSTNASTWVTGAVKTLGKAAWTTDDGTYRVCISAKLPGGGVGTGSGQGIWPAHWMMPADDSCDPDEGEMDIMEMVDGNGLAEATYHWQSNWPNVSCAYPDGHEEVWGSYNLGPTWAQEFHEFSVERSATSIVFAVDGVVIVNSSAYQPPSSSSGRHHRHNEVNEQVSESTAASTTDATPVSAPTRMPPTPVDDILLWPIPFYLILNSAVGGGWPGEPDANTVSPAKHQIDYVRVAREQ